MTRLRPPLRAVRRLASASDGNAAMEFAFVAPVFALLVLGFADVGHMAYARGVLNGAVEEAARSSSLETADTTAADNMVKNAIKPVIPNATVTTTRKSYFDFSDVGRPEKWTDNNHNGTCDAGEPYIDENRSGTWEADIGKAGNGGANDVVLYTVTVTYKPVFTARFISNWNSTRTMTAVGVRKNQPFASQTAMGSSTGTCP